MPPVTPRAMRAGPSERRAARGSAFLLKSPHPDVVAGVGLGRHLADLLVPLQILGEGAVAVLDRSRQDFFLGDRDRLEGLGLDPRTGPALQLLGALRRHRDEFELVAE